MTRLPDYDTLRYPLKLKNEYAEVSAETENQYAEVIFETENQYAEVIIETEKTVH